ncbi:MAG: Cof-type HAD-IIB family hydrolase [Clostridia bacterium]|jgi:Cof subfamily protein (haloacid dehalogenase superfamily)|nr:Cof-type HAD-IIB family hydrolase [Clostridia bacterium]MCI9413091.1 Cof-type HAD-IIB family hydrolase [Clostridia bacterium]
MSIKLIATDLDGTMLASDNSIPQTNLKAIQAMKEKHISLAVCTGKSYAISKDICKQCNAQYGIFGNGTQIIDLKEQKEIYRHCLTIEELSFCSQLAGKHHLHIHAYGDNFVITEELKYMDLRNYAIYFKSHNSVFGKYDSDFNLVLHHSQSDLSFYIVKNLLQYILEHDLAIFNVILSGEDDLTEVHSELKNKSDLTVQFISKKGIYKDELINKEYDYFSIAPQNIGKGSALDFLKDYLRITTSDTMSIGDNLNDIDLLKSSGIGVAVANAYEPVKKVATYTTISNASSGGFAEAVYQFITF